MRSTIYAIGLGPGDPELLTVKARRLLREVQVIFVPNRDDHESLARKILADLGSGAEVRDMPFRMSKSREENLERWRQHAQTLAETARGGQTVAFVTEGDPMLYSTFVHVYPLLAQSYPDVEVEIVPGVSSVTAGAAAAHVPLVEGNDRAAIVPATGEVLHALATFDTIVILKVSMALEAVLKALNTTGRTDDAIYVERVGWPQQRIVHDVTTLRKQTLDYFGQMIVTRR